MNHHVRVLKARVEPRAVGRSGLRRERLETATSMKLKKTATSPRTGTAQASRSRPERLLNATAAAEKPVRTRSQRSSEPSCPPQNAEIVYAVGSSILYGQRHTGTRSRCAGARTGARRSRPLRRRRPRSARSARRPRACAGGERREAAGEERIERQAQADDERCAPELRHGCPRRASRLGTRGALRHEGTGLADEDAVLETPRARPRGPL